MSSGDAGGRAASPRASCTPDLAGDVYLHSFLEPFRGWLEQEDVTEILVNRPGEVWVERIGAGTMERRVSAAIDDLLIERLATQVARITHQAINREHPLLAATLPGGERIQVVAPPASRTHWTLAIRRHLRIDVPLSAYRFEPHVDALGCGPPGSGDGWLDRLREAVLARRTIVISGGTSSGKTTFLNALLREVPVDERIVAVEDTPEIEIGQPNRVNLVAVRGEQGEARVGTGDLLQAALRLRPDRIILGEVRGPEALTFLRAINTGHPGSFTTIHANTPSGALEQMALMVMQTGIGLGRADILAYIRSLVDVVVQLRRSQGQRLLVAIESMR